IRPGGPDYKELIPVLLERLTDEDADVRQHVVHTLARIGQPAVAPLLDILKEKDGAKEKRANAAYALGKIGPAAREALPALTQAFKAPDRELRPRAAFAIAHVVAPPLPPGGFPGPGGMAGGLGGAAPATKLPDPGPVLPGRTTKKE